MISTVHVGRAFRIARGSENTAVKVTDIIARQLVTPAGKAEESSRRLIDRSKYKYSK